MRYGPRPRRVTAGATASWGIGIFVATVLVRGMINDSIAVPVCAAGLVLLVLWAVLWWRHRRRGVYVDDSRVWVKRVLRTDSVPLTAVTVVDSMPAKPAGVRRLVFHLEDGRHIATPLRGYSHKRDDPYGPYDVASSVEFTRALNDLQQRVTR
jgi:uncharacterized iron-regulated membrane protein